MLHGLLRMVLIYGVLACGTGCGSSRTAPKEASPDERLAMSTRAVLAESPTRTVGLVIVDEHGTRFRWFGAKRLQSGAEVNADTQFEIGSVSKVFAALLLADAEQRGEISVDDAIAKHLPGWKLPERSGRAMTFRHALTHTLGIADMMPSNWVPMDRERGVTRYTEAMFRDYLESATLVSAPGERYAYSNVGSSLIALALRNRTGMRYSSLLHERIFQPLGMSRSDYADSPLRDPKHVLDGYEEDETPSVRRIDVSPLGPSCVIRSTLRDMGRFISAALHGDGPLAHAFARVAQPQPSILNNGKGVALGWNLDSTGNLLRKNGQVSGYRSDLILSPRTGRGLYIVVNSMKTDITSLADAVLDALWPAITK